MQAIVISNKKTTFQQINEPKTPDNHIKVRVAAFGVNKTDFLQQQISAFEGTTPGVEFSGWVVESGKITHRKIPTFRTGARVCGFVYKGACAEYVVCDPRHLVAVPEAWSLVHAAGLVYSWFSAIDALYHVAGFRQRDKVLIHVGERTLLGTAMAQYAQTIGCRRVIVVVSSDAQADFIRENLRLVGALPDELVAINENRLDWVAAVKKIDPRGIQVVINETENDYESDCDVLAPGGSLIYIGPRHTVSTSTRVALKGIRVQTTNLRSKDPGYIATICEYFESRLLGLFVNKRVKVFVHRAVPWELYDTAVRVSAGTIEKVVCTVGAGVSGRAQ